MSSMILRSWNRNWCRALAAVGLGALSVSNAPGAGPPPPGQKIQFSQPTNANEVLWTNLSRFKPITDSLPQSEERRQGTLDFLSLESSMEGLPVPPPQYVVVPNRRLKERLERQRNWASMTPEEILLDNSDSTAISTSPLEDSSKPPAGQEKDKRSRPDYSAADRPPSMVSPQSPAEADGSSALRKRQGRSGSRDEADLPDDIKAIEKQIRDLQKSLRGETGSDPFFAAPQTGAAFFDSFGSDNQKSLRLDQAAHNKAVMEQFKQAIESPLSPTFSGSFTVNPFAPLMGSTPPADTLKSAPLARSPFSRSGGLDSLSSALLPPPPGVSDDALTGQSSLSAQPGLSQPVQQPSLTPPAPTFVFPKRVFQ